MTPYQRLIAAFEIFSTYEHEQEIHAEHDELFAGPDPDDVSPEDLARLEALGWSPSEFDCFRRWT